MKRLKELVQFKSLRWKLLSRFILILIFLLVIIEVFQYVTLKNFLYSSKEQILDARFYNLIPYSSNIKKEADVKNDASELINLTLDENMTAAIINSDGNIVEAKNNSLLTLQNKNAIGNGPIHNDEKDIEVLQVPKLSATQYKNLLKQPGTLEGYTLIKDSNGNTQIVGFRKIGNLNSPLGLVQLSTSSSSVEDIIFRQIYIFIIAAFIVLIIGSIIAGKAFKITLKPLYKMTDTVGDIDANQLNLRLPINNNQIEIDRLSVAFNNMMERIEISFNKEQETRERMRQFLSDASHELRTPLTSIHGFVEVLLRGAAKNEEQLDLALNSILMESDRLTKLVNDLLLLNRLDQHLSQEMKLESLQDIINEIYPQLEILCGKRSLKLDFEKNLKIIANRNQIKQVVFNLVQNSVNHTLEKDGQIEISVENANKFAVIKVTDNGSGIQKDQLNKIFDRFFRSEAHRSRKQGGYGLGLSIVKSIVDAHNGKIEVMSEYGKGTTILVCFKREK